MFTRLLKNGNLSTSKIPILFSSVAKSSADFFPNCMIVSVQFKTSIRVKFKFKNLAFKQCSVRALQFLDKTTIKNLSKSSSSNNTSLHKSLPEMISLGSGDLLLNLNLI